MKIIISILLAAVLAAAIMMTGCNSQSSKSEETTSTESVIDETKAETDAPTEKISNEDAQSSANQAYLDFLYNHSYWFSNLGNDYTYSVADKQIAFIDLNGDSVSEMILLRPTDDSNDLSINLCIVSFNEEKATELYDDQFINIPGAGPTYEIFINGGGELYSIAENYPNGKVTRYDIGNNSASAVLLAESKGKGTSEPNTKYYIDGSSTTADEYRSFCNEVSSSAKTYLIKHSKEAKDASMSYDKACKYLKDNTDSDTSTVSSEEKTHEDYSSYLGSWSYTYKPDEIPDEILNNEVSYRTYIEHLPTTSLNFEEINDSVAKFELCKGNISAISDAFITAEIVDGVIDFEYTDSWNSTGHGTITLNGDSVHVYCVEDHHAEGSRAQLDCDETLTR